MDKRETLKKLFLENGLEKEDVFKSPQGYVIITRSGIEKIQYKNKIEIDFSSEMLAKDFVVIKATGTKKLVTEKGIAYDLQIETYGEASPENCKNKYIVSMAEKRALSRCVLKMVGFYQLGVFGEDEADAFTRTNELVDGMD
jgi:hypothetical protein